MSADPTMTSLLAIAGEDRVSRFADRRRGEMDRAARRELVRRRLLDRGASDFEASVGAMMKTRWPEKPVSVDSARKYVCVVFDGRLP